MRSLFSAGVLATLMGCMPNLAPRVCTTDTSGVGCVCDTAGCADRIHAPRSWCSPDSGVNRPAIDFKEAALAARLCRLSYLGDDSIRSLGYVAIDSVTDIGVPKLGTVKFFVWRDTAAVPRRQVLVIRGTANTANTLRDLDYLKTYDYELQAWVHGGFRTVAMKVLAKARDLLDPAVTTCVAGHSLGGAAAVLVFLHLYTEGERLGTLYTFGQPKVLGGAAVLKYRCLPVVRFENEDDPVPYVPPTAKSTVDSSRYLAFGLHGAYQHLGDEVVLRKSGGYVYSLFHNQYLHGFLYAKNVMNLISKKAPAEAVADHDAALYVARISRLAEAGAHP